MPRLIFASGAVCLGLYLIALIGFPKPNGRVLTGDATHHFVQLRSLVYDHDLRFQNEYIEIYGLQDGYVPGTEWVFYDFTPTGHVRNYMPLGPALLWAPLYLIGSGVLALGALMGLTPWPTGFERSLQLSPGVTGIIAVTIAAWLAWRTAKAIYGGMNASLAVAGVWFGSHVLYYALVSPAYSHTASMLATTLVVAHWWHLRQHPSLRGFATAGALVGLASLMRWQDALFVLLPVLEAVRLPGSVRQRGAAVAAIGVAWLVVFSPQMAVWQVLYGRAFTVPQGAAFMKWTSPSLLEVLFSSMRGLFSWTPILLLAVIGLVTFMRTHRRTWLPVTMVLVVSWYVNAAVADWWAGEAFGARRFLSLFPLLVIGLAAWLSSGHTRPSPARVWIVGAGIVLNGLLLLQYQVYMKGWSHLAPYPEGWDGLWLSRFVVPFRILRHWFLE